MEIIKRGSIKPKRRKFTCDKCNSIFIAEESEYKAADQMEFLEGILAKCICPVCGNMAYVTK